MRFAAWTGNPPVHRGHWVSLMSGPRAVFVLAVLLFTLLSSVAPAQILNGSLSGVVTDPTDAVIPNAKVTVVDLASGQEYKETTNQEGIFTFAALPNGFYRVSIEASGFATQKVQRVQIFVSQLTRLPVKLQLATTGTEVVVEAAGTTVQTESVELKQSVDRQQIMDLPLATRNPLDLVKSFAGIIAPPTSNVTGGDAFVHGLRGNATNLTQDGINVADNYVKTSAFFALSAPIVDSVGEFNVSVGGMGVDAGFGAAQVSIVTQRGSNQFHGAAYWYQRTNALNANTWFNNQAGIPTPFQLQQRLGGNGGGPVYIPKVYNGHNKTFVFGVYEAYREPLSRARSRTVLTDSARQGNFTWSSGTNGTQTINLLNIGTLGTTGVKPAVNANVMSVYNKYVPASGLTDAGCANGDKVNIRCFAFNLPGKNIQDRYTIRVDHQLSAKHNLSFVWNQSDYDSTPDLLNGIESQFPGSPNGGQGSRRQVWTGAIQSVLASNKTNEARFGLTRAPVGFNYPYNFSDTFGYQVSTAGSLSNPILTSTNLPQGRNTPVRQVIDNFGWVKGDHNMRFGGEYRLILADSYFYNTVYPLVQLGSNSANPDGLSTASFPGGISAGDLGRAQSVFDTITGLLSSVSQGFNHTSASSGFVPGSPRITHPIQQNMAFYAQDSWRVRKGLTVQYGVRWEYQGVFDDRTGLMLLPQTHTSGLWGPTTPGQFFSNTTNGATDVLLTLQGANNGTPAYGRDLNNFAPFLGLAWDPRGDGKTAVRASVRSYFTQDGFTFFGPASTTNSGLFTTAANNVAAGVFGSKVPGPATPADAFPVSEKANFIANTGQTLANFDPNLVVPYVIEWNIGIQRQLPKRFTIEARYVGNHAVKQYRSWNINELNLNNNGLLTEFQNAQKNLTLSQAAGKGNNFAYQALAGQVQLPIFDKIFQGIATASGYGNSTFITNLQQNTIGSMFDTIRRSATYRNNITSSFPLNFFVANPWAASALQYDNSAWSRYNGLEVEVNRRFSSLVFQGTYTLSKVLGDATYGSSQTAAQNYLSVTNRSLDKFRAGFDVTQSFAMNFLYPLPIGKGKALAGNAPTWVNYLISGYNLNGFTRWTSGAPLTISTGRATTGSLISATPILRNMTQRQLQQYIGVFRGPSGVYFLDPKSGLININGASSTAVICTPGQTTPCFDYPQAGQYGNLQYNGLSGPHFFGQDAGLVKNTPFQIHEMKFNFEMRFEMFNVFNNANFSGPTLTTTSSTFGQLTGTLDSGRSTGVLSRTGQWAIRLSF